MDLTALAILDANGHVALDAITPAPLSMPQASLASPKPFVCSDGKTYWLKGKAQHGLAAELIGGRLAAELFAGPGR